MPCPPPRGVPYKKTLYFMPGTDVIAPIGEKICTMVELCSIGYVGFSTFGGDDFRGFQIEGGKLFFGQFVFDAASVTCVIYNCPFMRGRTCHSRYAIPKTVVQMVIRCEHSAVIDQMFIEFREFFMHTCIRRRR